MFRDVKILLVLPDTEEETIAMAHRFQPRYLTFVDKNIPALATVVDRMRKSTHRKGFNLLSMIRMSPYSLRI
jgi:hypothetical protein